MSKKILKDAEGKKEEILSNAKLEANQILNDSKKENLEITRKTQKMEERVIEREEKVESKLEFIEKKKQDLHNMENKITQKTDELDGKLSEISKLSEDQAKELFLKQISDKYQTDGLKAINKYKKQVEENKKQEAREIILKSIQQYAWDVTSEVTTSSIEIQSDDIKWKLIWKEGRNITTFEKATGVALIIDDTPGTVFISGFDLFRRYIAKKSLEKLIEDGRIQPARIEEIVSSTENEAESLLKNLWEKVLDELGITWLPVNIIPVIWKLRFRTSYGQNILKHSKEVAIIAESIAHELWADSHLVKVGGLLHDIWKALDQEIEWTHPDLWAKLGRKYKLDSKIIDMIENHHGEPTSISLEAAIVQVSDAISSVRPWARREAIEEYLKRVHEMESLVSSFSWVNKAFALSAGREIRVFVDADIIDDLQAQNMAKDIADNIEENLSYPWEVKVSLIREMRVIEYAK